MIDFNGNLYDHQHLIEFANNNGYHLSIQMAPYEALYGRICRSPIGWFEVGESCFDRAISSSPRYGECECYSRDIENGTESPKVLHSYRRRPLEFEVDDWLYMKISPMVVVMRFGKKVYIGPNIISKIVCNVAYELELPQELVQVHPLFHISMLKKCLGDPSLVVPIKNIGIMYRLSYDEIPI